MERNSLVKKRRQEQPKFRTVSLKKELVDLVQKFIEENPQHGYRSLAQFIEDAVRRRGEVMGIFLPTSKEET